MSRKLLLRNVKAKQCIQCNKHFYGSIDDQNFCSTQCKSNYIPIEKPDKKKVKNPLYPFTCKICNTLVTKGGGSRAHRQGVCVSRCLKKHRFKQIKKLTIPDNIIVSEKFKKESEQKIQQYGNSFYTCPEWLQLRYQAFLIYGRKCQLCNVSDQILHVDHIKPKSKFPELAFEIKNLQILCEQCNLGKSNLDETDWRSKS